MNIPKTFEAALESAYINKSQLDKLFVEQKPFIMRLVNHALRYKPWDVLSDENDLFQEACIWILHFMWEWDDTRETSLARFVTYNVGVRLQNQIDKERAQKRNPRKPPIQIINDDIGPRTLRQNTNIIQENEINGEVPTPEDLFAIKHACEMVDRTLPLVAREFLECLMLEEGNFFGATRRLRARGRIRLIDEMTDDAFRQWVKRKNLLSKIRKVFDQEQITL